MSFSIQILDSDVEIRNKIMQACINHMNKALKRAISKSMTEFRELIYKTLKESRLYRNLLGEYARANFGFPKGKEERMLDRIIKTIAKNADFDYRPFSTSGGAGTIVEHSGDTGGFINPKITISGGLEISCLIDDFSDVYALKEAYVENNQDDRTQLLPWLQWFLEQGGKIVIPKYHIVYGSDFPQSRSGLAIMVRTGHWAVPGDGTKNNNWLTTALSDGKFIKKTLDILKNNLKQGI